MQILNYLPNQRRLSLPIRVAKQVVHNLVEPFFNIKEARAFYEECPSSIVIFNRTCNTAIPDEWLNEVTTHFIKQAIENPEYRYDLPDEYEMMLTITHDAGNGLYVIKPKELKISFK